MKKFKLGTKLYFGFGLAVLILALVSANAFISLSRVVDSGGEALSSADYSRFIAEKEVDHLQWVNTVQKLFLENQAALQVQTDPKKCGLGKFLYGEQAKLLAASDPQLANLLEDLKAPHMELHESAVNIQRAWKPNHPGLALVLAGRLDDHRRWAGSLSNSLLMDQDITVQLDPTKCAFGTWLAGTQAKSLMEGWPEFKSLMIQVMKHHDLLHKSAATIKAGEAGEARKRIYTEQTLPELNSLASLFGKLEAMEMELETAQAEAKGVFVAQTLPSLSAAQAKLGEIAKHLFGAKTAASDSMLSVADGSQYASVVATLAGIIICSLLAFFITRSITKPVIRVAAGLNEASDQVSAASNEVANSSQQLAEGASEQAASIEETSASLEEITSMTRQNADNAKQANSLTTEANEVVGEASRVMDQLTTSMQDISAASDETSKIIKTIDEIAFQTNLLALNAAVEAARAGEAGAGFAVVADEVRSLAMRAAEAAKNTQALIQNTVEKVHSGGDLVSRADDAFKKVAGSTGKVAELVGEIAAASDEQAQGVGQINKAIVEMEKVTQGVAANAEESAAASEEMNAQAESMQVFVAELRSLVGGNGNGSRGRAAGKVKRGLKAPSLLPPARKAGRPGGGGNPKNVIPLGDDDFGDF